MLLTGRRVWFFLSFARLCVFVLPQSGRAVKNDRCGTGFGKRGVGTDDVQTQVLDFRLRKPSCNVSSYEELSCSPAEGFNQTLVECV